MSPCKICGKPQRIQLRLPPRDLPCSRCGTLVLLLERLESPHGPDDPCLWAQDVPGDDFDDGDAAKQLRTVLRDLKKAEDKLRVYENAPDRPTKRVELTDLQIHLMCASLGLHPGDVKITSSLHEESSCFITTADGTSDMEWRHLVDQGLARWLKMSGWQHVFGLTSEGLTTLTAEIQTRREGGRLPIIRLSSMQRKLVHDTIVRLRADSNHSVTIPAPKSRPGGAAGAVDTEAERDRTEAVWESLRRCGLADRQTVVSAQTGEPQYVYTLTVDHPYVRERR